MALSLVIATAGAGLLVMVGIWNSGNSARTDRLALLNAAESGIKLGAQWVQQSKTKDQFDALGSSTPISTDSVSLEGAFVTVTMNKVAGDTSLVSRARFAPCKEIVVVKWKIKNVVGAALPSVITFREWNESIQTCPP